MVQGLRLGSGLGVHGGDDGEYLHVVRETWQCVCVCVCVCVLKLTLRSLSGSG